MKSAIDFGIYRANIFKNQSISSLCTLYIIPRTLLSKNVNSVSLKNLPPPLEAVTTTVTKRMSLFRVKKGLFHPPYVIATITTCLIILGTIATYLFHHPRPSSRGVGGGVDTPHRRLETAEIAYQLAVQKRKDFLQKKHFNIHPWKGPYFWDYFVPSFSCPYSVDRVGGMGDGGKYVCGLQELFGHGQSDSPPRAPCVTYSFGVSRESSFEAEILERTRCEVYAYDGSVGQMGPEIGKRTEDVNRDRRVHFEKKYLGTRDSLGVKRLESLMKQNGHTWIDILKMDVEGMEYPVLQSILDTFHVLPFGQLLIEFHILDRVDRVDRLEGQVDQFWNFYRLWQRMEAKGLRPFRNEINLWPVVGLRQLPSAVEYSFINIQMLKNVP